MIPDPELDRLFAPRTLTTPDPREYRAAHAAVSRVEPARKNEAELLRDWWATLDDENQQTMTELFMQSPMYEMTHEVCSRAWKVGRTPLPLIIWAKQEAGKR